MEPPEGEKSNNSDGAVDTQQPENQPGFKDFVVCTLL